MQDEESAVPAIKLVLVRRAEFDIADAIAWLSRTAGEDSALNFMTRLDDEIAVLRESVGEELAEFGRHRARPHEAGSVYFARPIYRHVMQTVKRRARRSSAGVWHIYYEVRVETDKERSALVVHSIQHGASEPYTVPTN